MLFYPKTESSFYLNFYFICNAFYEALLPFSKKKKKKNAPIQSAVMRFVMNGKYIFLVI